MSARILAACLLSLALPVAAQMPASQQPGAPEQPQLPPPKAPEAARPVETARVVEREIAQAAGDGNEALLAGRYQEARASYEEAQVLAPELPELEYNRGVSLLLEGDFEDAERALEQGLSLSRATPSEGEPAAADPALASDGEFNLGHAAFGKQELDAAARRFARALAADPESGDARRNLELVLRAIQDQQQQEQQQQEQQEPQDQQQDQQDEQEQQDQQEPGDEQQDQQQEEQEQQDQQDQQEQQEPQEEQQPKPGQMSKEQIEQLLDALAEEERDALKREQEARKKEALPAPAGKDW